MSRYIPQHRQESTFVTNAIVSKLRNEPLRLRLYGLAVLVASYLVSKGVIDAVDEKFIAGAALLILAVEGSRAKVAPMSKL